MERRSARCERAAPVERFHTLEYTVDFYLSSLGVRAALRRGLFVSVHPCITIELGGLLAQKAHRLCVQRCREGEEGDQGRDVRRRCSREEEEQEEEETAALVRWCCTHLPQPSPQLLRGSLHPQPSR